MHHYRRIELTGAVLEAQQPTFSELLQREIDGLRADAEAEDRRMASGRYAS